MQLMNSVKNHVFGYVVTCSVSKIFKCYI